MPPSGGRPRVEGRGAATDSPTSNHNVSGANAKSRAAREIFVNARRPALDQAAVDSEGPSPQDLRRFGRETAWCPDCGAETFDDAERCPRCGSWIGGGTLGRPPLEGWLARRWLVLVALGALAALLLAFLGLRP